MPIHKYFQWGYHRSGWKHTYNLGTGLFVWLFLLLTRPFGVYATDLNHFFALALFLLPVGISFVLISYLVDYFFKSVVKIDLSSNLRMDGVSWMLKLVLFVNVIYVLRLTRCDWQCFDVLDYLEQWFAFGLMMLLTYIPTSLYGKSQFFRTLVGKNTDEEEGMKLQGEGKEQLTVDLNEIMLFKAEDNYVDLYISASEPLTKKTMRATLTSISNQLAAYPQFQRVHRSFVVNLQYTKKRNFNTLTVENGEWSMDVPLSPSFRNSLRPLLS